jgi:hypothetical protein
MKRTLVWISLGACATLIPSLCAAGELAVAHAMPTADRSYAFDSFDRPPDNPAAPTQRSGFPETDSPVRHPAPAEEEQGPSVEFDGGTTAEPCDTNPAQAATDESAFVVPTWSGVFWIMPPGGMTRFLIPQRMPINPEESVAPMGS